MRVPGDKSISHRSLMLAALAVGESRIEGLLEGEDVLATAAAMRAMGATIERGDDGVWRVMGSASAGCCSPKGARHGQFGHLDAAADGTGRKPSDHRDVHRRRLAVAGARWAA